MIDETDEDTRITESTIRESRKFDKDFEDILLPGNLDLNEIGQDRVFKGKSADFKIRRYNSRKLAEYNSYENKTTDLEVTSYIIVIVVLVIVYIVIGKTISIIVLLVFIWWYDSAMDILSSMIGQAKKYKKWTSKQN